MCMTHKLPSRREVMKLAAFSIPALALGTRVGEALAASGGAGTPSLERSSARPITARPPALHVGDVEITRTVETEGPMMTLSSFFSDGESGAKLADSAVEAHRSWLDRWALASDSTMIFSIQSLLVRTPRHLILVDTCLGAGSQEGARSDDLSAVPYFQKLRAAGVKPEDVDFVLCTPLHLDHPGLNTCPRDRKLVPTFPNAKYVFARREWDYWGQRKEGDWDFGSGATTSSLPPPVDSRPSLFVEPSYPPADQ